MVVVVVVLDGLDFEREEDREGEEPCWWGFEDNDFFC